MDKSETMSSFDRRKGARSPSPGYFTTDGQPQITGLNFNTVSRYSRPSNVPSDILLKYVVRKSCEIIKTDLNMSGILEFLKKHVKQAYV